jgi:7-carboxy-7-deazaguanine synthase
MTTTSPTIPISESFLTIQGEGALMGKPTVFVRTGGCDYRCRMCDTLYAVLPENRSQWQPMTIEEIFAQVQCLSSHTPLLVTLSGGNPAMHQLEALLDLGHAQGYTFALETQGSIAQPWFAKLDYLTISPKGPGMQNAHPTNWERLSRCITSAQRRDQTQVFFKIVIFDEEDYLYARSIADRYPTFPLYLQAGNHTPPQVADEVDIPGMLNRLDWLVQKVAADRWYNVHVLPQLHVILWGNKRGV